MTDLFSRIAERALGLAPSIQPMVTPFYAPTQQQESGDLLIEALSDESQSDERWQARATAHQGEHEPVSLPEPERPRGAEHTHAAAQPMLSQHAWTPEYPTLPQYAHKSEQPSRPEHAPVPTHPLQRQQVQHEHTPEYRNAGYPPLPEDRPVAGYPPSPATGYPRGVPLLYSHRLAGSELVDGGRARMVGVPLAGTLAQGVGTMDTSMMGTRPQATPSQAEQHTNESAPEGMQAAPKVHVTIGRIEVRATPAPATQAPAQRQQAAPKTMSLDEYLKQSGKGGRG